VTSLAARAVADRPDRGDGADLGPGWTIERVAYRPLRGSFRLAPLISAIGMSIFLQNFVQVAQGARNKPLPPMVGRTSR
jgi:branched-subunit amino acid ABC-type transport system permease component